MRVDLIQGTREWLAWRASGIGASDAAAIMHESPFQSAYGLWLLKTGRTKAKRPSTAMEAGTRNEATAREQFIRESTVEVAPACFTCPDADFVRASLDGWSDTARIVVEIKCHTSSAEHRLAREGDVPRYYWIQMQHQMAAADASEGIYYAWYDGEGVPIPVVRDEEFWLSELLPAEQEFWNRVQTGEWPPPTGEVIDDSEAVALAVDNLRLATTQERRAEHEHLIAEALIKRRCGNARSIVAAGQRFSWSQLAPRLLVQIDVADTETQAAVIAAVTDALRGRKGVSAIRPVDWAPQLRWSAR